jgi:ketosteroid isomerase-like protein
MIAMGQASRAGIMKGKFFILALAGAAWAMAAHAADAQKRRDAKQEVLDVTQQWIAAENSHDAAALDRILDDQFISTFAANPPREKAAFIKGITKGEIDPTQSQTITDEKLVVEGDTAVLTGVNAFHSTRKTPIPPMRFTITYAKRQGRWRALAEHIAVIPPRQ